MAACSAFGCTNRPEKKIPGITFHKFPKNERRRADWIEAVGRENWTPSNSAVLCSEHFLPEDLDKTSLLRVRIRENATPCKFSRFSSSRRTKKKLIVKRKEERKENEPAAAEIPQTCDTSKLPKSEKVTSSTDEASPEYILPECGSPDGSDEPYSEYIQPKIEHDSSPIEVCAKSTQTETDYLLNSNDSFTDEEYIQSSTEPYSSYDEACYVEFNELESILPLSSNGANKNSRAETDPSLSCIVGSEHQYSNNLSAKVLKQKLELACSCLVEAKKKLKIEQQRNRRARRTISRLKGVIGDLQMQSLSH